ncbi:MAG: lipoyl(octanoyl) transferase LipB [candidate division WOR-3 bacterium]
MLKAGWILDLGFCEYEKSLKIQKRLHQLRVEAKIPDTLILAEHPAVFTLGKSGKTDNLLVAPEFLTARGIKIYRIERGGDITFHGPGQIVGYPIFYIKDTLAGIRALIERLELLIILTLNNFGIEAKVLPKMVGVWVGGEKIASIGLAVKSWVSFHGFALNVATDLSNFDLIRPCGLSNIKMTSLERVLKKQINLNEVKERIVFNLPQVFNKKFLVKDELLELTS